MKIWFNRTGYWWFGHYRIADGMPYNRGFTQGFGPFALNVRWWRIR